MKKILYLVGLLFLSYTVDAAYTVGALDTTANGGTGYSTDGIYIQNGSSFPKNYFGATLSSDGQVVAVGAEYYAFTTQADYYPVGIMYAYDSSGSNNTVGTPIDSFSGGGVTTRSNLYDVAILQDNKVLVVGERHASVGARSQILICKVSFFKTSPTLDTTFNGAVSPYYNALNLTGTSSDVAYAILVDGAGLIYAIGTSTQGGQGNIFVARYTSAGVLDTTFNSTGATSGGGGKTTIPGIALISISTDTLAGLAACFDQNGKIVIAGSTTASTSMFIGRITVGTGAGSGILDTTFNTTGYNTLNIGGADVAYSIATQSDGKFVVAGTDGTNCAVARFTTTGTLDTTFGLASSGYNSVNRFGGSSAYAKGLTIQSDDKIVITGAVVNSSTDFVIARYLADGSALDIGNFGSTPANGYTVTAIDGSTTDIANAVALQQNGSFVVPGSEYVPAGSPYQNGITARYLGTQNVQGAIDFSYQSTASRPGFKTYPTDNTASSKLKVVAIYPLSGSSAGSLYVLTSASNTSTNTRLVKLNSTGTVSAAQVIIAQPTPTDVIADSNGKAVTIGNTTTPKGYIARYTSTAGMAIDSTFNSGAIKVETTNSTSFQRVCQQSTGRYVVIGQAATATSGLLIAYTLTGALDTTFGVSSSGFITMANATFYDLIVNSDNFMYVAFSNGTNLCLAKYLADGSGLVSSFGTSGIIDTGLPIANYPAGVCLSFDNSGNIVICASNTTTGGIALQRYTPTATVTASTTTITATTSLLTTPVITKIQCDTNNRVIFNGYDNYTFFIGRCTAGTFSLDTSFGPYSSCQGIEKSSYNVFNPTNTTSLTAPYRLSNTACITGLGNIMFGGYENITSTTTISVVGQVTGYTSGTVYTQVARFPRVPNPGTLNTDFGTNGALDLTASPASLQNGQARAMYTLASGKMLVADSNGMSTNLTLLDTSYALDTASFNTAGTAGYINLSTMAQATTMMIDASGNIYVLGTTSGGAVVVYKVNSAGSTATAITIPAASSTAGLTSAYDMVEQASGRILIAGYNGGYTGGASGVIMSYNPVADTVDTSFNPTGTYPGYWFTGVANPVTSIAIGTVAAYKDKIYFAYENGSSAAVVARLLENGTALDTSFSFGDAISSVTDELQIKMQLDVNGKIVLVAQTGATGGIRAKRYTANGANDTSVFTVLANSLGATLQKVLALSDGTTIVLGAVQNGTATSAYLDLARLNTACTGLDTTFNASGATPGVLTTNAPSSSNTPVMKDFYTVDTILAGGFLVAGDNSQTASSAHPYFAGIENTTAPTKVSQSATSTPAAGTLDTTFNPAGATAGFMNFASELQTTQLPDATIITSFLQQSNGTYFVGGSTGFNSYVTLMSDDDVQNSSFGTSGLLTISGKTNLAAMLLAQSGALLVVGGTGTGGWVRSYNVSTGAATAGFSVSTTFANYYAVAQQTMGRILVAGSSSGGVGKMIAYNSVTGAVDTTFADNGIYTATGYGAIQSMIVDSLDNIYIIANDASNNAKVMCLNSSGTAINWTTTFIATTSTVSANNHLAFNRAGNIVAVGVNTTTPSIVVKTFTPGSSGGTAGTALTLAVGATGITTPNVTSILVDLNGSPGKVIVTGYDTNTDPSTPFIMRINSAITALDTTFNTTGVQSYNTLTSGVTSNWYTGMINANGKITVGGYASVLTKPYVMRVYGDEFIGQYAPTVTAGAQGSINTTFGTSGELLLAGIPGAGALAGQTPQAILTTTTGQYYTTFADGSLVRLTNGGALDTTFNTTGFADPTPAGNSSIIVDGSNSLVLAGTDAGAGWVKRYLPNSGSLDTTFNSNIATALSTLNCISATTIVEQTLGRYIVAGTLSNGHGALFAFTNTGEIDTTFNNPGTPGYYDTGVSSEICASTVDQFGRLIIAYKNGSNIDVVRFTSAGQLDTQFNTTGTVTGAITGADDPSQVRIVLDQAGNIIVAAHTAAGISVRGLTTTGASLYAQLDIATVITNTPVLNDMIATSDGNILLAGSQSGANPMWVTRVTVAGALDTTFGGGDGIMTFSFDAAGTVTGRSLNSIAMYPDGQIALVGTETNSANTPTVTPFLSMAYSTPYTSQVSQSQLSQSQGTNDTTLGASTTTATNLGVTFFASAAGDATSGQVARAIALQDDANILVAVDGGLSSGSTTPSDIYLKMFNIDGVANTSFGTSGQRTVLTTYQNQNVQDMVTFTTVAGVHKAILAGYVTNTTFGTISSLLLQYNLDTHALDTTFGGFDRNPSGVAFGDGKQINVVGQQSTGRIIGSGISNNTLGLILGYTSQGKLDASFGSNGYLVQSESTGIYTHAIDSLNRIIIGWVDSTSGFVKVSRFLADGSGFDTSFGTGGTVSTGSTTYSNSGIKVAVDASNNVFLARVATTHATVMIYAYDTTGTTLYTAFTPALSLTTFNITQLIVDTTGLVYVIGYDTSGFDQIVIARILADLSALDTTFNPSTGYLKYAVAGGTTQAATDALIHPDGRIIVIGSEA
jgi:uncharacterized delta-60 repeat protein